MFTLTLLSQSLLALAPFVTAPGSEHVRKCAIRQFPPFELPPQQPQGHHPHFQPHSQQHPQKIAHHGLQIQNYHRHPQQNHHIEQNHQQQIQQHPQHIPHQDLQQQIQQNDQQTAPSPLTLI